METEYARIFMRQSKYGYFYMNIQNEIRKVTTLEGG